MNNLKGKGWIFILSFLILSATNLQAQIEPKISYYFDVGIGQPVGTFEINPNQEFVNWWFDDNENIIDELLESGGGALPGKFLTFGTKVLFPLPKQKANLGMELGFDLGRNNISWRSVHPNYYERLISMKNGRHRYVGMKLGPTFNWEISEHIGLNLSAKIHPVLVDGATWVYNYNPFASIMNRQRVEFKDGFGLKRAFSCTVELWHLQLGIEADLGEITFKESELELFVINGTDDPDPLSLVREERFVRIPMNLLKFSIGLNIGK